MSNILCLEPNDDIGALVKVVLKDHDVDVIPDSQDAFKALSNGKNYDMLIIEPSIGKYAYTLARLAKIKGKRVVYLTNLNPDKLISSTLAHAYIQKPFDPEYLKNQVDELLTRNGSAGSAGKNS